MELKELITQGGAWVPPRLVIYGDEKVGKTSTAAQAPNPLYIGTDDGRRRLAVDGLPIPNTWEEFVAQLEQVSKDAPGLGYGSVVTDTLNGAIDLCAIHVCETQFGGKWNDPKYGFLAWGGKSGWSAVSEEVRRILPFYDRLIDAGLWVILLAHSATENVRNPLEGDYDRFQPAINKWVWPRVAGWCDITLRVDYQKTVIDDKKSPGKSKVISDGTRVLRCGASLAESAGCRVGYELPDEIPFSWQSIAEHLGKPDGKAASALRDLWDVMTKAEAKKAEEYLGTSVDELEAAPLHKAKALISRLTEKQEEAHA